MYSAALRQLQTGCFSRNLLIQFFYILFPDADALRLALATNRTTTPITPELLESVSPLSRGVYAISARECLRSVRISLFPRLFFRPFKFYTIFTAEICSCYHTVNGSSSVPNHGIAATLAYVNQELTNTLVFLMSSRVRAEGGTRNALLQRLFRSAISRDSFRAEPDVASGIKFKYSSARISRLYLAPELRTNPPAPNRSSLRPPAT